MKTSEIPSKRLVNKVRGPRALQDGSLAPFDRLAEVFR